MRREHRNDGGAGRAAATVALLRSSRPAWREAEKQSAHLCGIMHVLKTGCRWVDCPPEYGPHKAIYNRFNRWSAQGIWQSIFEAAAETAERLEQQDSRLVDRLCRPWVLILIPGNTADCTVGGQHASVCLYGIKELLGDKSYDSNSFRKSLRKAASDQ
jgi:transposase